MLRQLCGKFRCGVNHITIGADKAIINLQLSVRSATFFNGLHINTRLTIIYVLSSRGNFNNRNFQHSTLSINCCTGRSIAARV